MALRKNEIPILEFDTEQEAMIMPGHHTEYRFPEKAVMLFVEPKIIEYAVEQGCEVIGEFESVTKYFNVYKTKKHDIEFAFVQAPLGGAAAVHIMEQLIAGGVREIIAAGCCGALVEDTEGSFLFPLQPFDRREPPIIICRLPGKCSWTRKQFRRFAGYWNGRGLPIKPARPGQRTVSTGKPGKWYSTEGRRAIPW